MFLVDAISCPLKRQECNQVVMNTTKTSVRAWKCVLCNCGHNCGPYFRAMVRIVEISRSRTPGFSDVLRAMLHFTDFSCLADLQDDSGKFHAIVNKPRHSPRRCKGSNIAELPQSCQGYKASSLHFVQKQTEKIRFRCSLMV